MYIRRGNSTRLSVNAYNELIALLQILPTNKYRHHYLQTSAKVLIAVNFALYLRLHLRPISDYAINLKRKCSVNIINFTKQHCNILFFGTLDADAINKGDSL
ncbi:hypothetical protein H5410_013400 [Solanum commersonii]|uniref:Uncharacterized protein n=1 Tax=Solanum commersonii TaxID=4109 RepID=A0A9J6AUH3_SOLCO|nr:hypothetical protein H5410_013400 [Solanum commersonii]